MAATTLLLPIADPVLVGGEQELVWGSGRSERATPCWAIPDPGCTLHASSARGRRRGGDAESSIRSAMFVATHARRSTKLCRSGMKSVRSHMPLLRSSARRLGALTIAMALLAELGLPARSKDARTMQGPGQHRWSRAFSELHCGLMGAGGWRDASMELRWSLEGVSKGLRRESGFFTPSGGFQGASGTELPLLAADVIRVVASARGLLFAGLTERDYRHGND